MSSAFHEIVQRVPDHVVAAGGFGSTEPPALLLEALRAFQRGEASGTTIGAGDGAVVVVALAGDNEALPAAAVTAFGGARARACCCCSRTVTACH